MTAWVLTANPGAMPGEGRPSPSTVTSHHSRGGGAVTTNIQYSCHHHVAPARGRLGDRHNPVADYAARPGLTWV